jgi:hypothetical protein
MTRCHTGAFTAQEEARSARVAAFITFHYRPHTMQYLGRVLKNLSDFVVARMNVTIVTNAEDPDILDRIRKLSENYLEPGNHSVFSAPPLDPPQLLTWQHKSLLRGAAHDANEFSHFLYLEDDIGFTFRNFIYFLEFVTPLRQERLIPSFIRSEFNHTYGALFSADAVVPMTIIDEKAVYLSGVKFVSPVFPYCACFIMDRAMIEEYIDSMSFGLESSCKTSDWGVSERSAMGLCWEDPPKGFRHRYVLPIRDDRQVLPEAQIAHMPSNYTNSPHVDKLGKLR